MSGAPCLWTGRAHKGVRNSTDCPYSAVLSLNSPGGSFAKTIRLARFIRK